MCFELEFSEFISFVEFYSKFLGFVPGKVVAYKRVGWCGISFPKSTAFTRSASAYNPSALCHIMQCNKNYKLYGCYSSDATCHNTEHWIALICPCTHWATSIHECKDLHLPMHWKH